MKRVFFLIATVVLTATSAIAQGFSYSTTVVDTRGTALTGAVLESVNADASAVTDAQGQASLSLQSDKAVVKVSCDGYYPVNLSVNAKHQPERIILIPVNWVNYSVGSTINRKDMEQAYDIDHALQNNTAGLQVVQKGGMPAEGAYLNIGGIHSIEADNTPLIVLNGVPYLKDAELSETITGYSRDLFTSLNINDIRDITVLTGAEAAKYGSLGSNGVILIETEQATSDNLDTRISLTGQYGLNFKGRTVDVLGADAYRNYLRDLGMTRYSQMGLLVTDYPFLQTSTDYPTSHRFVYDTDWQDEIYSQGFLTNNVFRVEGGDEIAKYNISAGYSNDGGIISGTSNERYHTLINAYVMVSRDVDIFSTTGLSYSRSQLQEQGMSVETNPMMAAWHNMSVLSPYYSTTAGLTETYARYDFSNVNDYPLYPYENVSNPTAVVNTLEARDKLYDVNFMIGINWRLGNYLKLTGIYNRQYRYVEENLFIPGVTNLAICPQYYGIGYNTVRKAINENRNAYYNVSAQYSRVFDGIHDVNASVGTRIMNTSTEYDLSSGFNTANDYYKTIDKTTDWNVTDGYINQWIWANHYLQAAYTWNQLVEARLTASLDGSSVSGPDAPLYYFYPAASLTLKAANLNGMPSWVNQLDINAQYAKSGNRRFSSNYGKNYYTSSNFFSMASIIRGDIPNTLLEPEKQRQALAGIRMSLFGHRLQAGIEGYRTYAYDLLVKQHISSVYAATDYYENCAAISTSGANLSLRLTPVETRKFNWTLGASLTTANSLVEDLGEQDYLDITYDSFSEGEDVVVRLQKGKSPYQFYGYETDGIYATTAEAEADGYTSIRLTKYQGGDVKFVDVVSDGVINEQDKVLLGSSRPDFFGSFFSSLRFGQVSLNANFHYSVGGKIYNAARRSLESMDSFHNQSVAVCNRWQVEGQKASLPRANYGDPNGNNVFSDRWIEDASYLKLGSLTLGYALAKPMFGLFQSGNIWVSAENLLTFSNYLGNDPEMAYSYSDALYGIDFAKVPNPRTVKFGFNLNF